MGFQSLSLTVLFPVCTFCNVTTYKPSGPHSSAPFSLGCPWSHYLPAAISCSRPLSMNRVPTVYLGLEEAGTDQGPPLCRRPLPCLSGGLPLAFKASSGRLEQV